MKKFITYLLVIFLIAGSWRPVYVVRAEEVLPEETPSVEEPLVCQEETPPQEESAIQTEEVAPTPTPETTIDNTAEVANVVTSEAVTGENTIEATTSAEPAIEETPEEQTSSEETPPEITPAASVETSDAVSVTEVENTVNTTEVNSQTIMHTLNIYVDDAGDIDLTSTPLKIAQMVFGVDQHSDEVVNVQVLDTENFAYLSNNIISTADTGNNNVEGASASIDTGDAISIVSLLNKVNTTIIDSTIHIVTINIFGTVSGNIILPEFQPEDVRACCTSVANIENNAVVENNVDSSAVSGQNSLLVADGGEIETGDAKSVVNIVNLVNTNLINVIFYGLYVNTLGAWTGDFLGWFGSQLGLGGIETSPLGSGGDCEGCRTEIANIQNSAYVSNNVSSSANTGGNSITGGEGTVKTGNAYSSVNIVNLVNSSIIGSWGFLGFINIFGLLQGDIGGESEFLPPPESEEGQNSSSEESVFVREAGGQLDVSHHHNVGAYVYPGDTVTFFVNVKNPGTGIVYGTKLMIELIRNGTSMGGGFFDLGDINPHKAVKVTTGLVLSNAAPGGNYTVRVTARGTVGPGDIEISDFEDSSFLIVAASPLSTGGGLIEEAAAGTPVPGVMGVSTSPDRERILLSIFFSLLSIYLGGRAYQRRRIILAFLRRNKRVFKPAAVAIRATLLRIGSLLT